MKVKEKEYLLSPSLMCMSFLNVASDINVLNNFFDTYHVDISDGHFCKNITLSPEYIRELKDVAKLPIEVHLMVESPNDYIEQLAETGVDTIIVHVETIERDAFRTIDRIHSSGVNAGIALCPETPFDFLLPLLPYVETVSIMNVDVGFIGQPLIPEMVTKTKRLSALKERKHYKYTIENDGGVRESTYRVLAEAGVENFVLGKSALFDKSKNLDEACRIMKNSFYNAICMEV